MFRIYLDFIVTLQFSFTKFAWQKEKLKCAPICFFIFTFFVVVLIGAKFIYYKLKTQRLLVNITTVKMYNLVFSINLLFNPFLIWFYCLYAYSLNWHLKFQIAATTIINLFYFREYQPYFTQVCFFPHLIFVESYSFVKYHKEVTYKWLPVWSFVLVCSML